MGPGHASQPTEDPDRLRPLPRQHPPAAWHAVAPPESRDAGKLARPVRGGAARKRPVQGTAPRGLLHARLHAQLKRLPWRQVPAGARQHDRGHGRDEYRTLKAVTVASGLAFPHAAQAICLTRRIRPLDGRRWRTATVYAITSLDAHQATPAQLAAWIRGHWQIEALHHIRDVTYREDHCQVRTGNGPQVMAMLRNLAIATMKLAGAASIAATRHNARNATRLLATLGLIPA